jgi:hypothetical protein
MPNKRTPRDPIGKYQREQSAARRVGRDQRCISGEDRPEALIAGSDPMICAACDRKRRGKSQLDDHHVAGQSNNPTTIRIPVNDHRAELSAKQYEWPRETLENDAGSPVIAAAGCLRGCIDTFVYLLEKLLLWIAEMLELLDKVLAEKLGPNWWDGTGLDRFKPKQN